MRSGVIKEMTGMFSYVLKDGEQNRRGKKRRGGAPIRMINSELLT